MAKKKTGKKPRRRRWDVSCEATIVVTRHFRVLASTAKEAMRICRERTGRDFDSGPVTPYAQFDEATQSETDWKAT
jgi:hypothetical protein